MMYYINIKKYKETKNKYQVGEEMVDINIDSFSGMHYYLSNTYEVPFTVWGLTFRSAEAAYQSSKTKNIAERYIFQYLSPKEAVSKGLLLRKSVDFDEVKEDLMYEILYSKFSQNEVLLSKLLDTGTRLIADEKEYKDSVDVGKILMKVREELKTQRKV